MNEIKNDGTLNFKNEISPKSELIGIIDELKIKKTFWLGFQLLLPLMVIFIELAARYSDNFGLIDFVKTQKAILVVVIIFLNLTAGGLDPYKSDFIPEG